MLKASQFVEAVEKRQGLIIACPEEIAYRRKWINSSALDELAKPLEKTDYGRYLRALIDEDLQI